MSDEWRGELVDYLEVMHDSSAWQEVLETNGWTDDFRTGEDFEEFLVQQDERVSTTLDALGLI